jgi:hypothetical protein
VSDSTDLPDVRSDPPLGLSDLTSRSRAHTINRERPHFVYEFWSDQECLWVGVTRQLGRIIDTHSRRPWWPTVTRVAATRYVNKSRAMDAAVIIRDEAPPRYVSIDGDDA